MGNSWAIGALKLSRIPSTTAAFLVVFIPTYIHTQDGRRSFAASLPLALISICIFILNDLNDLEKDTLNHPARPLPSGLLSPQKAVALYLIAFVLCLGTVQFTLEPELRYIYLAGFLIAINYSLIVDYIPRVKAPYVALCASLPLVLVAILTDSAPHYGAILGSFCFVLGRELLMDLRDVEGDGDTIVKSLKPVVATRISFALQAMGLTAFASTAQSWLQIAATAVALTLFTLILAWWRAGPQPMLLQLMKIQMLCAVAFLL